MGTSIFSFFQIVFCPVKCISQCLSMNSFVVYKPFEFGLFENFVSKFWKGINSVNGICTYAQVMRNIASNP